MTIKSPCNNLKDTFIDTEKMDSSRYKLKKKKKKKEGNRANCVERRRRYS